MSPQSYSNVLQMIGNTPLVAVNHLDTGPCRLFLKLENQNPGGSIKDRVGLYLIEAAEREGRLPPGGTLIEATAGNTGLGLALVAAQKGYRLLLVIPDKMSQEKIFHLKAMGAEVVLTRSDVSKGHPEYYRDLAERLATRDAQLLLSSTSSAIPPIPRRTRRPPLPRSGSRWITTSTPSSAASEQAARLPEYRGFFARIAPDVDMVLADPVGSVLAELCEDREDAAGARRLAGRGHWRGFRAAGRGLSRVSSPPTPSPTRRRSRPAASCCARKASWRAPPPARWSPRRCATAASRPAEAGRQLRLRQRQQVPLQGLQRLLDARSGIPGARALRRPAGPDRAPPLGARRGHRELHRDASWRRTGA